MATDYEVLMKIIKGRRSVRRFKAEAVEREKIRMLIEAARGAPSAGNAQPWEFVIISNRNIIDKLKTIMAGVMGNIKEGPVLICICVNKNKLDRLRYRVRTAEYPLMCLCFWSWCMCYWWF